MKWGGNMLSKIMVVFTCLCIAAPAYADNSKKIMDIKAGQTAKFDGVLLSPSAFAELKAQASTDQELVTLRIKYELDKEKAKFEYELKTLESRIKFMDIMYKDRLRLRDESIDRLETLVYDSGSIWDDYKLEIGGLLGVSLSIGSFLLHNAVVNEAKK